LGKDLRMFHGPSVESLTFWTAVPMSPADIGLPIVCVGLGLVIYFSLPLTRIGVAMEATMDNQTAAGLVETPGETDLHVILKFGNNGGIDRWIAHSYNHLTESPR
jgi:hypothetical protein